MTSNYPPTADGQAGRIYSLCHKVIGTVEINDVSTHNPLEIRKIIDSLTALVNHADERVQSQRIVDSAEYLQAADLLDGSPGQPEYVRALADMVTTQTGYDGDLVLALLTAFNEEQHKF